MRERHRGFTLIELVVVIVVVAVLATGAVAATSATVNRSRDSAAETSAVAVARRLVSAARDGGLTAALASGASAGDLPGTVVAAAAQPAEGELSVAVSADGNTVAVVTPSSSGRRCAARATLTPPSNVSWCATGYVSGTWALTAVAGTGTGIPVEPPVTGMFAWWDAADTTSVSTSAGAVTQWADRSGNSRHLTQATPAARPTSGTTTRNSLNVLTFDGGDALVSPAAASVWTFLHTAPSTVFVAGRRTSAVNAYTEQLLATRRDMSSRGWSLYVNHLNSASNALVAFSGAAWNLIHVYAPVAQNTPFALTAAASPGHATPAARSAVTLNGQTVGSPNLMSGAVIVNTPEHSFSVGAAVDTRWFTATCTK